MSRCLNCCVAIDRMRKHSVSCITQPLHSILTGWLSIQELPTDGLICNACYVLLKQNAERGTRSRELGYTMVCIGCGCSIRGRSYIVRHHTLEENSPLIDIFFSWNTLNQDRRQTLRACQACWIRAKGHLAQNMPQTAAELDKETVEFVIKEQLTDGEKRQCHLCLSVGRRMQELGDHTVLYRKLLFENNQNTTIPSSMFELLACWECVAELRRVRCFQEKVRRANAAFETGQNNNCGNFSNLSVVLINDATLSVECEAYVEETAKLDPLDPNQEPVNPEMKSGCEEAETELLIKVAKDSKIPDETQDSVKRKVIESKELESEPKRSRTEEVLEEKPAEETTSLEGADTRYMKGLDYNSIFGKVKIEFEELQSTLKERRNNESFKSMKYKCESCVLAFSDYIRLQEHNMTLHDEAVGRFSCDVCERRFVDADLLSAHYRTHFVKFVCNLCAFECYTKTGRMAHFRKHEDTLKKRMANSVFRESSRRRVSYGQLEQLWEFVNSNREIATGFNKTSQARELSKLMWKNAAKNLNSHRDGATKDWKSWCKYWNDYKSKLKKMAGTARSSHQQAGDGAPLCRALTEIENRFLRVLEDNPGSGLPGIRVESFKETSQQNDAINSDDASSFISVVKNPVLCEERVQPGTSRIVAPPPKTPTQAPGPPRTRLSPRLRPYRREAQTQGAAWRALIRVSERRAQKEEENTETLKELVQEVREIKEILRKLSTST